MKEIEAISSIFVQQDTALFLRRTSNRTFSRGLWDLMGGDIPEGKTPLETVIEDALAKLNIRVLTSEPQGEVLVTEGVTAPIRRHCFVCIGDYSNIRIDRKKYSEFGWFDNKQVGSLALCPGVHQVLQTVGFVK